MKDLWSSESLRKQISEILRKELIGYVSAEKLNEIILSCDSSMAKAANAIEIYKNQEAPVFLVDEVELELNFENVESLAKAIEVFKVLSVFEQIGFTEPFQKQSQIVLKHALGLEVEESFEIIKKGIEMGFVEEQGSFIWIKRSKTEFIKQWLNEQKDVSFNNFVRILDESGTSGAFAKQMVNSSKQIDLKELIELITKPEGLLRNYTFLNTESGSRLLMHFVELAPVEIGNCLAEVLLFKTKEELRGFESGRRNLIWAIEKLAFRKETFSLGARLLYKFTKENEDLFVNNSATEFIQLFQVVLSGTQANLNARLDLLNELYLQGEDPELILKCFDRALMTRNFIKMSGVENQGGETLSEYYPSTLEIHEYWRNIIRLLTEVSLSNSNFSRNAANILFSRFNQQLLDGLSEDMIASVEKILEDLHNIPPDLKQQFAYAVSLDWDLQEKYKTKIREIEQKFSPKDIKGILLDFIKIPPYKTEKKDGRIIDLSEETARRIAVELQSHSSMVWLEFVAVLLEDEQRQAFSFGHEIGKSDKNLNRILDATLTGLKQIPFENRNTSLVEGIIAGKNDQSFTRNTIDKFLAVPEIAYHAIRLNRFLTITYQDVFKLFRLLEINYNNVISFQYLDLKHLSNFELESTILEFIKTGDTGHAVSVDVVSEIVKKEPGRFEQLSSLIDTLLFHDKILSSKQNFVLLMQYSFLATERLKKNRSEKFAIFLSKEVVDVCKEINLPNEQYIIELSRILLKDYWDVSWPIIGELLISDSYEGWWNVKSILEKYDFEVSDDLLSWLKEKGPVSASRIVEVIHFEEKGPKGEDKWSDLALKLIDEFGSDDSFLKSLAARLHSYFTSGSALSIFNSRISLLKQLGNHPIERVKIFSKDQIAHFNLAIEKEKKWIDNYKLGEI